MMLGMLKAAAEGSFGWWDSLKVFADTPAPYSPFSEYLLLLFVMWLIARVSNRPPKPFDTQAQEVLDQKYAEGEITPAAYNRFRQEMSLRPKR
jgi:uncharacterized membrane protein